MTATGRGLAALGIALVVILDVGGRAGLAEPLPPAVAAVIDYQRVLQEASAAVSIRQQVEARREAYQEEIEREERRLREANDEFARQRSQLSAEVQAERRRDFEEDVMEVQRMVQERRQNLDRSSATALNEVKQALIDIVTELAEERGFNIVLSSSEVLFFARTIDLTEDVLDELNGRLPEVEVPDAQVSERAE